MNNAFAGIWTTHFLACEWLIIHHFNQKKHILKYVVHGIQHISDRKIPPLTYKFPPLTHKFPPLVFWIPLKSELFTQICVILMHEQLTRFVWITHFLVWIPHLLVWIIYFLIWITIFLVCIPHFLIWITYNNSFPRMNNLFLCIWISSSKSCPFPLARITHMNNLFPCMNIWFISLHMKI